MEKETHRTELENPKAPANFTMKRFSSLAGLFIVLFLFEHLLTNSQAALFFGDDGKGFVDAVNFIYSLPYLPVIEFLLLGVPIGFHAYWGLMYLYSAKPNSLPSDGTTPALPKEHKNQAYTWQRITAILLIFAIGLHVAYMRFLKHPKEVKQKSTQEYFVLVTNDPGLYTLKDRLDLTLYSPQGVVKMKQSLKRDLDTLHQKNPSTLIEQNQIDQAIKEKKELLHVLQKKMPKEDQILVGSSSFGTATLMVVRNAFQSIWLCILYSLFVLIACFHAMNGVYTFAISWGLTITERSRIKVRHLSNAIMYLLIFLGLSSIWGSYWINLRY